MSSRLSETEPIAARKRRCHIGTNVTKANGSWLITISKLTRRTVPVSWKIEAHKNKSKAEPHQKALYQCFQASLSPGAQSLSFLIGQEHSHAHFWLGRGTVPLVSDWAVPRSCLFLIGQEHSPAYLWLGGSTVPLISDRAGVQSHSFLIGQAALAPAAL